MKIRQGLGGRKAVREDLKPLDNLGERSLVSALDHLGELVHGK